MARQGPPALGRMLPHTRYAFPTRNGASVYSFCKTTKDERDARHFTPRPPSQSPATIGAVGDDDDLLTTPQLAEWLAVSEQWCEIGRHKGYGPPYVKRPAGSDIADVRFAPGLMNARPSVHFRIPRAPGDTPDTVGSVETAAQVRSCADGRKETRKHARRGGQPRRRNCAVDNTRCR